MRSILLPLLSLLSRATAQTVMPPPSTISGCSCSNLCPYPADGWCDDGGPGSEYNSARDHLSPTPTPSNLLTESHLRPYSLLPRHRLPGLRPTLLAAAAAAAAAQDSTAVAAAAAAEGAAPASPAWPPIHLRRCQRPRRLDDHVWDLKSLQLDSMVGQSSIERHRADDRLWRQRLIFLLRNIGSTPGQRPVFAHLRRLGLHRRRLSTHRHDHLPLSHARRHDGLSVRDPCALGRAASGLFAASSLVSHR